MTDITKCVNAEDGKGCPVRETCYRWTALDSENQDYQYFFDESDPEPINCEHYWKF